jgi:hypothetical protein
MPQVLSELCVRLIERSETLAEKVLFHPSWPIDNTRDRVQLVDAFIVQQKMAKAINPFSAKGSRKRSPEVARPGRVPARGSRA